jgi:2-polyprenyl-3-methyl-5-hydroxy-6-metoxy-1,4-benzoquinol methylase
MMLAQSGFNVVGVDPSESMLELAKRQDTSGKQLKFCLADDTVLQPDSYDAIVCSSVIEYVCEPDKLLHAFYESLHEAGVLIISYGNKLSPLRLYAGLAGSKNAFKPAYQQGWSWRGFRKLLARNGFGAIARPSFYEFHWKLDRLVEHLPLGVLGVVAASKRRNQ